MHSKTKSGIGKTLSAVVSIGMAAVVLLENHLASAATPQELPPVHFGPKPVDAAIERRPHRQPKVPEGAKEIPFDETVPEPALTEPEKARGYLLFQRPLTESVYVIGTGAVVKGSHTVAATLAGAEGAVPTEARQDLAAPHRMVLPLPATKPGAYTLRLTIWDAEGKKCSESAQPVTTHAGPLY